MLDEFRSSHITWDKATSRIYSTITANESDENGRKLVVQIINGGQVEDLTGASLHLYWETRDKLHDGLDAFKAVDLKKGEFELSYTTGMLSNKGVLNANLVLVDAVGRVVSERFKITVTEGIDNDAIQSENSFTTLTQALIDISNLEQNYAPRLNDLTAQLQHKADQAFVDSQFSTIVSGAPKGTYTDLTYLQSAYPSGAEGVFLVLADGHWYYWNATTTSWTDGGLYQSQGIGERSIQPKKTTFLLGGTTNLFIKADITSGQAVSPVNGSLMRLASAAASGMIPVKKNTKYIIGKSLGSYTYGTAFYTAGSSFVSSTVPPDISKHSLTYTVIAPENGFMRTSMLLTDVDTQVITEDLYVIDKQTVQLADRAVDIHNISEIKIEDNNLYDKSMVIYNGFISASGSVVNQGGVSYAKIPVLPATKISILRGSQVYSNATGAISFWSSADTKLLTVIPSAQYVQNETFEDKTYITLTVPENTSYMLLTTRAGFGNDEDSLIVNYGGKILGRQLKSIFGASVGTNTGSGVSEEKPWKNKTGVSFGDSITWYDGKPFSTTHIESGTIVKGYQAYMREELGCTVDNKGQSGWAMPQILNTVKAYDYTHSDFATLTSGANDHRTGVPVGVLQPIGSTFNTSTYAGAMQSAIEYILNAKPDIKLYLITPIKGWFHTYNTSDIPNVNPNAVGVLSSDYPNVLKEIAELYSLPICDLYNLSTINEISKDSVPLIGDNDAVFTAYDLHPTNKGYERMASVLIPFFKTN